MIGIRGLAHIGVRVHDLERSAPFYRLMGVAILERSSGPVRFPTGDAAIFVRDPDGNAIELHPRRSP
jgi:catechol 2,3-dioxygenase-like lactoylglutathione lyase family enzyme